MDGHVTAADFTSVSSSNKNKWFKGIHWDNFPDHFANQVWKSHKIIQSIYTFKGLIFYA